MADGLVIVNAVMADVDMDGRMDVVLSGQKNPTWRNDKELTTQVFFGNGLDALYASDAKFSSLNPHPTIVDLHGTMLPSFLVNTDEHSVATFAFNASSNSFSGNPANLTADGLSIDCQIAHPHSNAFLDFNGDCLADLFLMCVDSHGSHSFQIWVNGKSNGFRLALKGDLPDNVGQISFADMDSDGAIDMVFPVCTSKECTIHIAFNQQMPLCTELLLRNCRDPHNLCVADDGFKFDLTPGSLRFASYPLSVLLPGQMLLTSDYSFAGVLPNALRIGDYNNDGYPDLMLVTISVSTGEDSLQLLRSDACRSFTPISHGLDWKQMHPSSTLMGAAFMDIDHDGELDMFLVVRLKDQSLLTLMFVNGFYNDAFFLKSIVLNGVCSQWCPDVNKSISRKVLFNCLVIFNSLDCCIIYIALWRKLRWQLLQVYSPRYDWKASSCPSSPTAPIRIPINAHPIRPLRPRPHKQLHRRPICRRNKTQTKTCCNIPRRDSQLTACHFALRARRDGVT